MRAEDSIVENGSSVSFAGASSSSMEPAIREIGVGLIRLVDAADPPSIFSRKGLSGRLMEWAMRDEQFKTQLFRFVDVLPVLNSSDEVVSHFNEYLNNERVKLSPGLRAAMRAGGLAGGFASGVIRSQVADMARLFILGNKERGILQALRRLRDKGAAFTVDILGETVVSEAEADTYAQRYLDLINFLASETASWPGSPASDVAFGEASPRINVSIKISAFSSQIHPADPETAIEKISERLRPVLRRAKEVGAFVNFDMEHHALKDLTLRLFKSIFSEPEFAERPAPGIALQAYLHDTGEDLRDLIAWTRLRRRRVTVRLIKGAYWDYETIVARQRGWPEPVFARKAETDANFEKLTVVLLENPDAVGIALGTHNIRSIAHALAQADRLGVPRRTLEFQMLRGMAESLSSALIQLGLRVREYCPVGDLLPGMAYLVRRLLENTSNESFLANKFEKGAGPDELLKDPKETLAVSLEKEKMEPPQPLVFQNEPPADFTRTIERQRIRAALQAVRARFGKEHPLVINNKFVAPGKWVASLNPADQREIIGYAAQASLADAESAVAAARAAQPQWARRLARERAELLECLALLLQRDKADLTALEILEAGKNWTEANADVVEAIDFCKFYAEGMRELGCFRQTQAVPGEANLQHWLPRGVGVIIAPWNFPLAILAGMTVAAIVGGNTVVIKPSERTPVIAARLMGLLLEAGLPPGVVNLATGPGGEIGAHLVSHPQVDFIAFTGSMNTGLKIWEAAGRTQPGQASLKKVVCEMGGKNALIVDSDADLDEAVAITVASAFGYQGQKCSALSRLIVLEQNGARFLDRLVAATASLSVGPSELPGIIIGPVIDRAAQERILAMIEVGKSEATLAWQGDVPSDPNACYVPPVIFTDVSPGCWIFREEIFGPVLAVTTAKSFDEALVLANSCDFALTGGICSRSLVTIERAAAEMVCGNFYINRPITGAIVGRQPFGGFKMSGGGTKAGGAEYLQQFLVPRVVTENLMRHGFAPSRRMGADRRIA